MRKYILLTLFIVLINGSSIFANKKIAQSGFQFLSVTSDAKAAAMGEAMTAMEGYSSSLFFNPAGIARMPKILDVTFSQNTWIADINYNAFSLSFNPFQGRYGVLGVTLISVDYGKLQGTMNWGNPQGYIDTEIFNPSALAFGVGYAKALSDQFSVGGQVKSTYQYLGKNVISKTESEPMNVIKNTADAIAVDFGTLYKTGLKSLAFGMSVRNYSKEIEYEQEGFQLPLTFAMGISMNLMDFVSSSSLDQSLYLSIDATHPRSHPEQVKIGLDYKLMNMLSLRGGYVLNNDIDNVTFGMGVSLFGLVIDYAYTPFEFFDYVQRFTIRFSI